MSNAVLRFFRDVGGESFKDVPDDQLTQFVYQKYPEFLRVPEFRDSVREKISRETRTGDAGNSFPGSDSLLTDDATSKGRVASALQNLMRGGSEAAGKTLSALSTYLGKVAPYVAAGSDNQQVSDLGFAEIDRQASLSPAQREIERREAPMYKAGVVLRGAGKEAFVPNPDYDGELPQEIARAAGELPLTVAISMLNPALGVAQYSSSAGESAADEAYAAGRADVADSARLLNTVVSAGSQAVLSPFARIPAVRRLAARKGFVGTIGKTGAGEAGQEVVEQIGGNIIAKSDALSGYDNERGVFDDVLEAAGIGFLLGSGLGGGAELVNSAARGERKRAKDRLRAEKWAQRNETLARQMADGREKAYLQRQLEDLRPILEAEAERVAAERQQRGERPNNQRARRERLDAAMNQASPPDEEVASGDEEQATERQYPETGWAPSLLLTTQEKQRRQANRDAARARGEAKRKAATAEWEEPASADALKAAKAEVEAAAGLLADQERVVSERAGSVARPNQGDGERSSSGDLLSESIVEKLRALREQDAAAAAAAAAPQPEPAEATPAEKKSGQSPQQAPAETDKAAATTAAAAPTEQAAVPTSDPKPVAATKVPAESAEFVVGQEIEFVGPIISGLESESRIRMAASKVRGTYEGVDEKGNTLIKVTSLGSKNSTSAEKLGLSIGSTVAIADSRSSSLHTAEPVAERGKSGRRLSDASKDFLKESDDVANELPEEVITVRDMLLATGSSIPSDSAMSADLNNKFHELEQIHGRRKAALIVAASLRASITSSLDDFSLTAVNTDQVITKTNGAIRRWFKNVEQSKGDLPGFSAASTISLGARDARRSAVDSKKVSLDTPLGEDSSVSLVDRVVAREAGTAGTELLPATEAGEKASEGSSGVNTMSKDVIAGRIVKALEEAERSKGGKLSDAEIEVAVANAYRSLADVEENIELAKRQGVPASVFARVLESRSLTVAGDVTQVYKDGGIAGVKEDAELGRILFSVPAPKTATSASLAVGEFSLSDAARVALAGTPDGSVLSKIVGLIMRAGVNPKVRVLSDQEFDADFTNTRGRPAFYDTDTDTITIRQSSAGHDYLIAHEAIHAATVQALRTDAAFLREMLSIRDQAISAIGSDSGFYGLTEHGGAFANAAEFVAEAMGNEGFQSELSKIKAESGSLWSRFKSLLGSIFGFSANHKSLLDAVMSAAEPRLRPNDAGAGGGGVLFGARQYSSQKALGDALAITDNAEGKAAIEASVGGVSALLNGDVIRGIMDGIPVDADAKAMLDAVSEATGAERLEALREFKKQFGMTVSEFRKSPAFVAQRRIGVLLNKSGLSDPAPLSSIDRSTEAGARIAREAAVVVDRQAVAIEREIDRTKSEAAALLSEYASPDGALNQQLEKLKSAAGAASVTASSAVSDYSAYLWDQQVSARLEGRSKGESALEAAASVRRKRTDIHSIADAFQKIAEALDEATVEAATSNADIVRAVIDSKALAGHPAESSMMPDASGAGGILMSYRGLLASIRHLSSLRFRHDTAVKRIESFEAAVSKLRGYKKDRKVDIRRFIALYNDIHATESGISEISGKLADMKRKAESLALYAGALEELTSSTEYIAERRFSAEILGKMLHGYNGRDVGNYHVIQFGDSDSSLPEDHPFRVEEFKINNAVNNKKVHEENLVTYMKMLGKLDAMISDETMGYTPEFKLSLAHLKLKLQSEMDARPEGALLLSSLDAIALFRKIPGIRNFMTPNLPSWLVNGRLGATLRAMETAIDSVTLRVQKLRTNNSYGRRAIEAASVAAAKSHIADMPAEFAANDELRNEWWVANVLEHVLSQNQDNKGQTLSAGDFTTGNVKVTKEDIAAAKKMAAWSNMLRQIVESTKGAASLFPSRIIYDNGRFSRMSYASGALTVSRILNRAETPTSSSSSPVDLMKRWLLADKAARTAMVNDGTFFDVVILPFVADLNPEFTENRRSALNDIYRKLAYKWRKEGGHPTNFDELSHQIASLAGRRSLGMFDGVELFETEGQAAARFGSQLVIEVDKMIQLFEKQLTDIGNQNAEGFKEIIGPSSSNEATLLSHLDAENSFRRPRVDMIAPSTFYKYELATPSAFGALEKGATLEMQIAKIKLYDEIEAQISEAIRDLDSDVDVRSRGDAARKDAAETGGDIYMSRRRLKSLLQMIEVSKAHLRGAISVRPPASESHGVFARLMHSMKSNMLLMSSLFNFISGGFISRPSVEITFSGPKGSMPVRVSTHLVKLAHDTIAYALAGNPAAARWFKSHGRGMLRPVLGNIAMSMESAMRASALIPDSNAGIMDELSSGVVGEPGEFSVRSGKTAGFKLVDDLLNAPIIRHVGAMRDNVLSSLERATTITSMIHADKFMRQYFTSLARIIDGRVKSGKPGSLDFSDPSNRFTAKELASVGVHPDVWARAVRLFSTSRRIESVALDYYKRVESVRRKGGNTKSVNWTEDQGVWDDIIVKLAGMNNLPLRSNRPDIVRERTQLGDIARVAILFPGWSNGYLSTLQLMQTVSGDKAGALRYAMSVLNIATIAVALGVAGLELAQIRAWLYRLIYGRPYPAETLTDLIESPSPEMAARTLASAYAATIPYFGEYIATALGAQNYRGSFTDLANTSLPLKIADTIYSTARSLAVTGDAAGAALSLQRSLLPPASLIVNRLPAVSDRNASADAVRVARLARGDIEVPDRAGSGRGYQPSKSGSLVNRAIAAASSGNMEEAGRLRRLAISAYAEAGKDNPEGVFASAVKARSPDMKAFGRRLTDGERASLIGRMGSSDRSAYIRAENAIKALSGSGKKAASGFAGRLRAVKRNSRPQRLNDLRKRIRSIKRPRDGSSVYAAPRSLLRPSRMEAAPSPVRPYGARTKAV
jgi:hypothetical protein